MTLDEPLYETPQSLEDWQKIAEQYELVTDRWLSGQRCNGTVICFNHAAGLRYGPSKSVMTSSGSAERASEAAELKARLTEARRRVWLIAQIIEKTRTRPIGGDDASITRRYAFQTSLMLPSRRVSVLPQLNKVDTTPSLDL